MELQELVKLDFTTHPAEHGMTYTEHFCRSMGFSFDLCLGSLKAFVHAILPQFFISSSTEIAKKLHSKLLA